MTELKFESKNYSISPSQKIVVKPWGSEIIYTPENAPAVGKIINVNVGQRLSLQYHDQKIETLCLIKGEAILTISDSDQVKHELEMELNKGYFIQPGQTHRVFAKTDITFIEASTPETGNTYRLEDDTNRPTETEEMRQEERD